MRCPKVSGAREVSGAPVPERTRAEQGLPANRRPGAALHDPPASWPPTLCYHRIGGPLELGVTRVSRAVFARQMGALAAAGWRSLTLAEFATALESDRPAARTFLLTFDDGYTELADHAYPVLSELGFTATTFLITDYVGAANAWDVRYTWRRLRHLDWPTVERWKGRGLDFGSHGATHRRLTWLADGAVAEDLTRSRDALVARLGPEAGQAVAYPFGATNRRVARLAEQAGFSYGFGGVRTTVRDRFDLPRVPVYTWDAFPLPLGLREDGLGRVGRAVAHLANRCSVGTSWMLRLWGR